MRTDTIETCIILGDAPCLEDDLRALEEMGVLPGCAVMAINRAGLRYLDPLDFWATLHPAKMGQDGWQQKRIRAGGDHGYKLLTTKHYATMGVELSGSSSLFGALWALRNGFGRVILAGVPLTGLDRGGKPYARYRKGWELVADELLGRVESMSGWTKEFLNELTAPPEGVEAVEEQEEV